MKLLIYGSGVIGTIYGWQLSMAGQDVTLLVRPGKKAVYEDGVPIRCRDERGKKPKQVDTVFKPKLVESLDPDAGYDLILVCVKSNQVASILPDLAQNSGKAEILFFQNNWWGDEKIREHLHQDQYFFGFSRLVGGWRKGLAVEAIVFNAPGMSTMIGEKDGQPSRRSNQVETIFKAAGLKPEISPDILSWLKFHYVEYIGPTGAILRAGSAKAFAGQPELIRQSILATREALAICQARGVPMKSAPFNLRLFSLPVGLLVWIAQKQYQAANIQRFFDENIENGLDEIADQYQTLITEGSRLKVAIPALSQFEGCFR